MTDIGSTMTLTFTPASLEEHPEVVRFLGRLGLGTFVPAAISSLGGRNLNWAGETTTGHKVFVKAVPPIADIARDALRRTRAYEEVVATLPVDSPLRSPAVIGFDEEAGLIAYTLLPESRGLNSLAVAGELGLEMCHDAGRAIGVLHGLDAGHLDDAPLEMPPLGWLRAMPVEVLGSFSMAQLAGWNLVQNDHEVVARLHALRAAEAVAPKVPVHGDLRMDQFLLSGGLVHLCDWEYFRRGDAARDVGAFIGELAFQAIYLALSAPDRRQSELDHAEVMRRGRDGVDRAAVLIGAFWAGYLRHVVIDAELPGRAVAFAGWHMFDRLITWGENNSQLNPVAKAIAGIGRNLLTNPEGAARLFDLTVERPVAA